MYFAVSIVGGMADGNEPLDLAAYEADRARETDRERMRRDKDVERLDLNSTQSMRTNIAKQVHHRPRRNNDGCVHHAIIARQRSCLWTSHASLSCRMCR